MTIDLTDTTTGAINDALRQARLRLGGVASGMVLTLVIVTSEGEQYDAVRAASVAGRQHPCRILVVIIRRPEQRSRLGPRPELRAEQVTAHGGCHGAGGHITATGHQDRDGGTALGIAGGRVQAEGDDAADRADDAADGR